MAEPNGFNEATGEEDITRVGNPAHPEGALGAAMLERMNRSHAAVTNWALGFLALQPGMHVLDIGCGGGATMRRLGRLMGLVDAAGVPAANAAGHVTGVDYSPVSCASSREFNEASIAAGRMDVVEASVESLPFADATFDAVTTVESFYFWPNPLQDLREVARVLRPGAPFLLVADIYRKEGLPETVLQNIERYHLDVLDPAGYRELILNAGFARCDVHLNEGTTWICVEGTR